MHQLVILPQIGLASNDAAGHGPFVDAEFQHQKDMQGDEGDQQSGNHEDMHREKARKRCTGNDRAAQHERHQPGPKHGNAAHNRCSDSQSPIGILVEPHHLSRKAHAECHQEKEDAEYPRQLTRIFVGAEEEDLSHVDQDNGDHEIRTPAMQGPNEPSERDAVIESLQAVPGLSRGRHVNQRKKNSGDDLKKENGERGAAEDVKPTCGITRDRVRRPFRELTRQA